MRANDRHVDKFCGPIPDSPSLIGMLRPALALGSLVVTAALLTACASEPEPEWTEEEAYAAAEETFRAYWGLGLHAEKSESRPFVTESFYRDVVEAAPELKKDITIDVRGEPVIDTFTLTEFRYVGESAVLDAVACIDASTYELNVDDQGWQSPRDDTVYGVSVSFESSANKMLVAALDEDTDATC